MDYTQFLKDNEIAALIFKSLLIEKPPHVEELTLAIDKKCDVSLSGQNEDTWCLYIHPSWMGESGIYVYYDENNRHRFTLYDTTETEVQILEEAHTVWKMSMLIHMRRLRNLGISEDVFSFLHKVVIENRAMKIEDAKELLLRETDFIISDSDVRILGIENRKGNIIGRRIGI